MMTVFFLENIYARLDECAFGYKQHPGVRRCDSYGHKKWVVTVLVGHWRDALVEHVDMLPATLREAVEIYNTSSGYKLEDDSGSSL